MRFKLLFSFISTGTLLLASTQISGVGATNTQAVIRVTTDQAGSCTYRISQSPTFSPLVHDVDTSLFAGSNSDSRIESLVDGKLHTFIVGLRTSGVASDGKMYSRALQTNTQHYYGVTCGSDSEQTGTFNTQNIPFGDSYPESAPFNTSGFGNYAWPSIDFTDATKTYIDPMKGTLLKRITGPGWNSKLAQNVAFSKIIDVNSAWTNPNNALTWPGTGTVATYSGASSDPLFFAIDPSTIADYGYGALSIAGWKPLTTNDDILFRTYGSASSSSSSNNVGLACISMDSGHTCVTPEKTVTLPSSIGVGTTAPSTGFPKATWLSWTSTKALLGRDFGVVLTTVTTSGTTITNLGTASAQLFNTRWGAGCKLTVNGTETYTISSVTNSAHITTVETMTTHASPVAFKSNCAGIRFRKQTATGTITLSAGYDLAYSSEFGMPLTGVRNLCSQQTITVSVDASGTAATPRTARLCALPKQGNQGHALFAFFPDNGEARLLSNFNSSVGAQYHSPDWVQYDGNTTDPNAYTESDVWDASVPTRFWTFMYFSAGPQTGHYSLVRVDYTGNYSAYSPYPSTNGYYDTTSWPDDHLTYTIVGGYPSANMGVDQQTAAFGNTNFDPSVYTSFSMQGIISGKAIWTAGAPNSSEDPIFIILQDLTTGIVSNVIDTISTYPLRFWGNHSTQLLDGQFVLISNILGNKGTSTSNYLGGFFTLVPTQINKSSVWTTDTSLTASYADACPGTIASQWQALGAVGNNCVQIQAKQPCSSYAGTLEKTNKPCPWDASQSMLTTLAAGDRFWINYPNGPETMRVVTTPTVVGTGIVQFWALRHSENYGSLGGAYTGNTSAQTNGWTAIMIPPEARTNGAAYISSTGSVQAENWTFSATHSGLGIGTSAGNISSVLAGADPVSGLPIYTSYGIRYDSPFATQAGTLPTYNLYQNGHFGGLDYGGGAVESYISMMQRQASAVDKRWFLDFHHLNPSDGLGQEIEASVGSYTSTLSGSTIQIFSSYPGIHTDIKHYPTMAYAGPNLLKDISGPSSVIASNTWAFCYVYVAGECASGSTVGQVYTNVPKMDTDGYNTATCIAGWYAQNNPCAITPYANAGWALQFDASRKSLEENYWRKLTQGLSGMGRQYQFGNVTPDPSGQWSFFQCYWCDGMRNDVFAMQMPPLPSADTAVRSDFTNFKVSIGSGPGVYARAKFGYLENGTPANFYCTTRQETCVTDTVNNPFSFVSSDSLTPSTCSSGCTITIPALPGRILYYKIERLDSGGNVIFASATNVATIQ